MDVNLAYGFHFWYMRKDDAINVMTNFNLIDGRSALFYFLFFLYKMSKKAYY